MTMFECGLWIINTLYSTELHAELHTALHA